MPFSHPPAWHDPMRVEVGSGKHMHMPTWRHIGPIAHRMSRTSVVCLPGTPRRIWHRAVSSGRLLCTTPFLAPPVLGVVGVLYSGAPMTTNLLLAARAFYTACHRLTHRCLRNHETLFAQSRSQQPRSQSMVCWISGGWSGTTC